MSAAVRVDSSDASAGLYGVFEYDKFRSSHYIRDIVKLHTKTHIGLVRAVTLHGVFVFHSLHRDGHVHVKYFLEHLFDKSLVYVDYIVNVNKRKLHIHLGKLRLTVSP